MMPLHLLSTILPALASATCYWQNSTLAQNNPYSIAQDDTACFPGQTNSPCCGTGWSCLSDGVCFISQDGNDFYYRGTCTDKTWNSQQCPGWCFAEDSTTSIPLVKCTKPSGEDWYCCPNDPECDCDSGKNAVKLGASQPVTATVIGSTSWSGFMSTSVTAGNIASQGTSTSIATTTVSDVTTTATPMAAGKTADPSPSPSSSSSSSNNGSRTALAAGLGAGLGALAVALAAAVAFLIRRARRHHRNTHKMKPAAISDTTYGQNHSSSPGLGGATLYEPLPTQPLRSGYYATLAVNEKDGRPTWETQELPSYTKGGAAVPAHGPVEMIGSPLPSPRPEGTEGRVELA